MHSLNLYAYICTYTDPSIDLYQRLTEIEGTKYKTYNLKP